MPKHRVLNILEEMCHAKMKYENILNVIVCSNLQAEAGVSMNVDCHTSIVTIVERKRVKEYINVAPCK